MRAETDSYHEFVISTQEAASGAEIRIRPSNLSEEDAFLLKLPSNLTDGTILRCINGNSGEMFFLKILIKD